MVANYDSFSFYSLYELFPNIPLVFCGIDHIKPERIAAGQVQIYGIEEADSTSSTIDFILSIRSYLATIVFIADDTSTGKLMVEKTKLIELVYPPFPLLYIIDVQNRYNSYPFLFCLVLLIFFNFVITLQLYSW